jgi:hypothetical protein
VGSSGAWLGSPSRVGCRWKGDARLSTGVNNPLKRKGFVLADCRYFTTFAVQKFQYG